MKIRTLHLYTLAAVFLLIWSACSKNDDTASVSRLPRSIVTNDYLSGTGTSTIAFTYDDKNRVKQLDGSFSSGGFSRAMFEYDADDKLTKMTRYRGTDVTVYDINYIGYTPVRLDITQGGTLRQIPVTNPLPNVYHIDDLTMTFNNKGDLQRMVDDGGDILMELTYSSSTGPFHSITLSQPAYTMVCLYLSLLHVVYGAKNEIQTLAATGLSISAETSRDAENRITNISFKNVAGGAVAFEQTIAY